MKAAISPSKEQMVKLGMPEFTVEDFYDNFMDTLVTLGGAEKISACDLDTTFNELLHLQLYLLVNRLSFKVPNLVEYSPVRFGSSDAAMPAIHLAEFPCPFWAA